MEGLIFGILRYKLLIISYKNNHQHQFVVTFSGVQHDRIKSFSEIHKTSIDIDLFVVTIYERIDRFHCHATKK